ncbi:hypothetical protein PHMEG_00028520 [Phytophthora megakarya]|uniref:Uncharacterized protein n=1 Tax=Phytophthora megakarya TaxID=4795 RepID=A0A225V6A8_9STRA|nr:hypothetical protein PHMEG_00028520 [Phytophthora megakarya]
MASKHPKAGRVFLCEKPRREHTGIPITCFDLWHRVWRNGTALPSSARKRKICARMPATSADKAIRTSEQRRVGSTEDAGSDGMDFDQSK